MTPVLERAVRAVYRTCCPQPVRSTLRLQVELLRGRAWAAITLPPAGKSILVLAPHMDDEVFGCGGTLAQAVQRGSHVTVAYLTDGRKGHPVLPPGTPASEIERIERDLVAVRKREASMAGRILGFGAPVFLDLPDKKLEVTATTVSAVAAVLRDVQPQMVFMPFLTDSHRDHWMTNCVFVEAARRARMASDLSCWGYEVWAPVVANRLVDVTAVIQRKIDAMHVFESQLSQYDYARATLGLNSFRGLVTERADAFAEAFYAADLEFYRRLWAKVVLQRHGD